MRDLRSGIVSIINSWDPIGLMSHAPDDEYNPEVNEIMELINTTHDDESLAQAIHQLFLKQFGDDTFHKSVEDCIHVAAQIRRLIAQSDA